MEVNVLFLWGTICDEYWDYHDASVVCRQLGLPYRNAKAIGGAAFGKGSGPIWLSRVHCQPCLNISDLDECGHPGWGNAEHCDHNDDAGVICEEGML